MKKLTSIEYCDYYASKCITCKGQKRLKHNGVWIACICQINAHDKFRFEQFDINPPDLKYKSWDDFTGIFENIKLTNSSFISAKTKALAYCFNSADLKAVSNRKESLIVHKHIDDCQNLIITGVAGTGKSLIASLIIKEVIHACRIHNLKISFEYAKSNDIQDAARWTGTKEIDHVWLDRLSDVDFLIIDGIDIDRGGHTTPPDHTTVNKLFSYRKEHPNIIICSTEFFLSLKSHRHINEIVNRWGEEFLSLMRNDKNIVIELEKDKL